MLPITRKETINLKNNRDVIYHVCKMIFHKIIVDGHIYCQSHIYC